MNFIFFSKIGDNSSIAVNRNKILSVKPHTEGGTVLYMQDTGMQSSYHISDDFLDVVARLNNPALY
jgi:hypothetical protein